MSERLVSNPIELQKLSLVDRQKQRTGENATTPTKNTDKNSDKNTEGNVNHPASTGVPDDAPNTPKHRTRPVVPIASPRKSMADQTPELPADDEHDELLKLASKQREIFELEQKLKQAKLELKQMEEEVGRRLGLQSSGSAGQQDGLKSMIQKRIEEMNKSPNVIRTKKSVSNLLQRGNALLSDSQSPTRENSIRDNYRDSNEPRLPPRQRGQPQHQQQQQQHQQHQNQQQRPPPAQPRQPPRPSQRTSDTASRDTHKHRPQSSFFGRIVDKFHEMNQEEADFDKKYRDSAKDKYYIGETYGYDDEIEDDDEPGEPLEHINDIPTSVFKR